MATPRGLVPGRSRSRLMVSATMGLMTVMSLLVSKSWGAAPPKAFSLGSWASGWTDRLTFGSVGLALGAPCAVLMLTLCFLFAPMLQTLVLYWRVLFFFWTGGSYEDSRMRFRGLTNLGRAHLYSLASVPWLMRQPHYRAGTFQVDMLTNLRNVVMPTGVYGVPLSELVARSRLHAVAAALVLIPFAAFIGSIYRRCRGLEASASACFARSLLAPRDWLQLWRLNCRLASMTALASQSKDFDLEDKWVFIKACQANGIPVTPVMDMPVTLVAKDVNEEGGLKNVMHGGQWILQEKLENCAALNKLLPKEAPLSTMRVVTGSRGALSLLGVPGKQEKAKSFCTVWRAGRAGAATDHSSVMMDLPDARKNELLGKGSSSAHWYARGLKSLGMPLSTADGANSVHPDTGVILSGCRLEGAAAAAELCERAHDTLMPTVPLAGWDVAFCPSKDKGGAGPPELVLLEANLSCNFFRGSVAWEEYGSLLDAHFAAIDVW
eukprot:CAMPEP_0115160408 /NCGR_PEP_ID=MMETSP0227-20121206/70796_1 /TAXON_ID=89957 /ORGANISM="Polarella glacialis, Strain CCMP 1383" /LENGTH=492 /DNA_ID=CAMNT_0002572317 /DNA_START=75 /DNA_END=1550 /DNA_ORIENTATION=+